MSIPRSPRLRCTLKTQRASACSNGKHHVSCPSKRDTDVEDFFAGMLATPI
jgi:hypothetical protein